MTELRKECPYCKESVLEEHYIQHLLSHLINAPESSKTSDNELVLTYDESGRIISLREFAKEYGDLSDESYDRYLNIHSNLKVESSNVFQKIANMEEKPENKPKQPLKIECRHCHKFIEKSKINDHNRSMHPKHNKTQQRKQNKKEDSQPNIAPEGEFGNMAEAFWQAMDEKRYGAKGMHHRHEWDGKFGSTPLHDDYSDEADSD